MKSENLIKYGILFALFLVAFYIAKKVISILVFLFILLIVIDLLFPKIFKDYKENMIKKVKLKADAKLIDISKKYIYFAAENIGRTLGFKKSKDDEEDEVQSAIQETTEDSEPTTAAPVTTTTAGATTTTTEAFSNTFIY